MYSERTEIKILLVKHYLSHSWLRNQLQMRGLPTAECELSEILSGKRATTKKGGKAEQVIKVALDVLKKYDFYEKENSG